MQRGRAKPKHNRSRSITRAVFLDRDGVINQKAPEGRYITSWERFRILPDAARGISLLNHAGFRVFVVTNQRCVARGLLTEHQLRSLHAQMVAVLARAGATIDEVYYCPHEASCSCRKPAPGMLLEAARTHNIEIRASWMIGDSNVDMEAGKNVGCKTALVKKIGWKAESGTSNTNAIRPDILAASLLDAAHQILGLENRRAARHPAKYANRGSSRPG